ncbi:MAG: HAD family hydrolase [Lachnospiraceae bacterium]|nr:HAD family hydrolase [Lachnospiraceae bacterium]
MYKLIVCDLDETLLNSDKKICQENIDAIKKARDLGVKFVPATGRGYTCIDYVLNTLELYDLENEYAISNNGAIVTENRDFRHVSYHGLSNDIAMEIVRFGIDKRLCVQAFTAKDIYTFNINEDEKQWLFMFKPDAVLCPDLNTEFLESMEIVKVMFQHTDVKYLASFMDQLSHRVKEATTISYSSNRYMEFTAKGIDKGTALRELTQLLGVDLKETLVIGDNNNDLSMLKVAGVSAAVGNATQEVKDFCDYQAVRKNGEGAVAEIIEKYIF